MDNTITKIEKARQDLNEMGLKRGFNDPEVIEQSRMLDELINEYYRSMKEPAKVKAAS
ncbi:MAG: aspartyl-phosphate phosphatase Spo0E family protein [Syntrophomonadaceae bacterium]|nr:aspartyl-phosphate phosphatase Spo0E family protein [Syntrophomonadaceae bacterium]